MTTAAPQRPRPLLWWDAGVAVLLLVLCVPGGIGAFAWGGPVDATVWGPLAVLAVFLVLYLALGRPALRRAAWDLPRKPIDLGFLAALVLLVGGGAAVSPSFATLQAIVFPMIWVIAGVGPADLARLAPAAARTRGRLRAVGWSGALALAMTAGSFLAYERYGMDHALGTALGVGSVSFGFAVILGMWITAIYEQGERHRALAEQLRRAQEEVAALSAASGAAAERERLSRELHDTLTQTLAGLVMLSEQTERALAAGDAARAAERAGRVSAAARESVIEARALVATTQPLGDGGLTASLERVAARLEADTGLVVERHLAALPLDREQEVVLLRAAQEGLANARRHARASRVELRLAGTPGGGALLTVADDGVGPARGNEEPAGPAPGGFGLTGLADRARALGGAVRFGPGSSAGSVLEVELAPRGAGQEEAR